MNRTLPFAVRITAGQAATSLRRGIRPVVMAVYFVEVLDAGFNVFFFRFASRHLEKLQWMFQHQAACRSDSMSDPSSVAFGLTTQNFGRKVR